MTSAPPSRLPPLDGAAAAGGGSPPPGPLPAEFDLQFIDKHPHPVVFVGETQGQNCEVCGSSVQSAFLYQCVDGCDWRICGACHGQCGHGTLGAPEAGFTVGCWARVLDSVDEVRALAEGHGDWCDEMEECCGAQGYVEGHSGNGDVAVRFPDVGYYAAGWTYNPGALSPLPTRLLPGQGVRIIRDVDRASQWVQQGCTWHLDMAACCGKSGHVVASTARRCEVQFPDGKRWIWHRSVLVLEGAVLYPTRQSFVDAQQAVVVAVARAARSARGREYAAALQRAVDDVAAACMRAVGGSLMLASAVKGMLEAGGPESAYSGFNFWDDLDNRGLGADAALALGLCFAHAQTCKELRSVGSGWAPQTLCRLADRRRYLSVFSATPSATTASRRSPPAWVSVRASRNSGSTAAPPAVALP